MDLTRKAISRNDIAKLLVGKGNYSLKNESVSWTNIYAPVDWTVLFN